MRGVTLTQRVEVEEVARRGTLLKDLDAHLRKAEANSYGQTQPVGTKLSCNWGQCDMNGSASEWSLVKSVSFHIHGDASGGNSVSISRLAVRGVAP